jgi:hypothetical protein
MQESQPLRHHLRGEKIDAGRIAPWPCEAADQTELAGSSPTPNTIGIVAVAALAANAKDVVVGVAITATRRRTRSAITAGRRSYSPSSQWYSIVTFSPST